MGEDIIIQSTEEKDPGITIDENLNFKFTSIIKQKRLTKD
jgi:hypothetical protein